MYVHTYISTLIHVYIIYIHIYLFKSFNINNYVYIVNDNFLCITGHS